MNQAFFTRIVVERDGEVHGNLAPPFALLMGGDLLARSGRERRSRKVVSPVRHARTRSPIFQGSGLTQDYLVAPAGFEPAISTLRG